MFCQFFPERTVPHFCSPPWTPFTGCCKSAAAAARDLILGEVGGKCRWKMPICSWHRVGAVMTSILQMRKLSPGEVTHPTPQVSNIGVSIHRFQLQHWSHFSEPVNFTIALKPVKSGGMESGVWKKLDTLEIWGHLVRLEDTFYIEMERNAWSLVSAKQDDFRGYDQECGFLGPNVRAQ